MKSRQVLRRLLGVVTLAALAAGLLLAAVRLPDIARWLVFTPPPSPVETLTALPVEAAQDNLKAHLRSLGLDTAPHTEELQDRQDSRGTWQVWVASWLVPPDVDPQALAHRAAALARGTEEGLEVYVTATSPGKARARLYTGPRLAAIIDLVGVLQPWPIIGRGESPALAVVIHSSDSAPHVHARLLSAPFPLALALSPYSPFTLRLARDAVLGNKEVLAEAQPDLSPGEALEAVPNASGLLVISPPAGTPSQGARQLRAADAYVIDASPDGLSATWLRALHGEQVPYVRALAGQPATMDERLVEHRHMAVREGGAVLATPVDGESGARLEDALEEAAGRGFRIEFPAEVSARLAPRRGAAGG